MTDDRRPPDPADMERVVGVFDALMQRLMATHAPELNLIELTMSQTKAMYLVIAGGPLGMSELARGLRVTNSTATGQVDRLVELGLMERHERSGDRRHVVVSATPHGIETLERFRELNSYRMRQMLEQVDAADLPIVEQGLRILHAALPAVTAGRHDTAVGSAAPTDQPPTANETIVETTGGNHS